MLFITFRSNKVASEQFRLNQELVYVVDVFVSLKASRGFFQNHETTVFFFYLGEAVSGGNPTIN